MIRDAFSTFRRGSLVGSLGCQQEHGSRGLYSRDLERHQLEGSRGPKVNTDVLPRISMHRSIRTIIIVIMIVSMNMNIMTMIMTTL